MNLLLEKRPSGTYYFRQTFMVDKKQVAKRINLKTSSIKIAKLLAIQLLAKIQMDKIKKFDAQYDNDGNLIKVNVDTSNTEDIKAFMLLQQQMEDSRAFKHKRELERLKIEVEIEELKRDKSQDKANEDLFIKLTNNLSGETIENLVDTYFKDLTVSNAQTRSKYLRIITNFKNYCLKKNLKYLNQLERKFVKTYIELLKKENQEDKNIKNIMGVLGTFFRVQIRDGETTNPNPFTGHKFTIVEEEKKRENLTIAELNKIFSSEFVKSNQQNRFIILLLLTTACRPNEICQLMANDIYQETDGDIYIIDINDNGFDKTLKNRASKRKLYLSDVLIKNNFLKYLKSRANKRLFDLTKTENKNFSVIFSDSFSKLLRTELDIKEKVLYSFRHTSNDRLKQNLVNKEIREDLLGHTPAGVNGKTYSQKYNAKMLKEHTQEILKYKEIESSIFKID